MCPNTNVNRRTVLKGLAAGATSAGVASPGSASGSRPGAELEGKRAYVERSLGLELPENVRLTSNPREADVAFVAADTSVSSGRLVGALNGGTAVTIIGEHADETLLATLCDVPRSEAATTTGELPRAKHLRYRFGVAQFPDRSFDVAMAVPRDDALDTSLHRTNREVSDRYVLERVDRNLGWSSGDVSTSSHSYNCPHADSGWHCIGRLHYEDEYYPYGQVETFSWGAKAVDETDSSYDYWGWENQLTSTPGIALWGNNWENEHIVRSVAFPSDYELIDYGPPSEEGSSSFSASVDIGLSDASLGWGWSETYSDTQIYQEVDTVNEDIEHEYFFVEDTGVAENSVVAEPGYRIRTADGTSSVVYDAYDEWKWREQFDAWPDNGHKETYSYSQRWYE